MRLSWVELSWRSQMGLEMVPMALKMVPMGLKMVPMGLKMKPIAMEVAWSTMEYYRLQAEIYKWNTDSFYAHTSKREKLICKIKSKNPQNFKAFFFVYHP